MRHDVGLPVAIVVIVVVVLPLLATCVPQSFDLPFETIVQEVGGGNNSIRIWQPLLRVAANAEEMAELKALTDQLGHSTDTGIEWSFDERLDEVDFSTHLVIAAFQGRKQTGGYKIEIVSVRQRGYQVSVIANFLTVSPGTPTVLMKRSPYHVIKVKKTDLTRKDRLIFVLMSTSGRAKAAEVREFQLSRRMPVGQLEAATATASIPPATTTPEPYPLPPVPSLVTPTPQPYPPPATPIPTFTPSLATPTPIGPEPRPTEIVVTLVPPEVTDALTQPIQITTRSAPRGLLAVDGNYVVWRSHEEGQTNIVAYNLTTGEERRISSLPGGKTSLRISGNYVVWAESPSEPTQHKTVVRIYDLVTSSEAEVGSSGRAQDFPDISGSILVWSESRNPQDSMETSIYGYDLQRGEEFPVAVGPGMRLFSRIDGDWVIYLYWPPGASHGGRFPSQPTLRAHHLGSGEDIELGPAYFRNDASCCESHTISGHRIVWRGLDGETYLYDLVTRQRYTLPIPWAYNELELHGNVLRTGSHELFNVESKAMLQLFRTDIPFSLNGIASDGQTVAWIYNAGGERHICVARFRRLP